MFKNIDKTFKVSVTFVCWLILICATIYLFHFFSDLLSILAITLTIVYILSWPIKTIENFLPDTKKVSKRFIATLSTYIVAISIIIIILALMVQPVSRQIVELSQALPKYIIQLENEYVSFVNKVSTEYGIEHISSIKREQKKTDCEPTPFKTTNTSMDNTISKPVIKELQPEATVKSKADIIEQKLYKQLETIASNGAQSLIDILLGTFRNIMYTILILILSFYFLLSTKHMHDWAISLINKDFYKTFSVIEHKIHSALFGYIMGQATIGLITGVFMWCVYYTFGLKYTLVLALMMGFGQFIPFIGQGLAIIPAVIVALVIDPLSALMVFIIFLIFQVFSNNVLVPKLLGDMTGLNPIIVIIALIVGEKIAGILGILFAVPVASTLQILIINLYPLFSKNNNNTPALVEVDTTTEET